MKSASGDDRCVYTKSCRINNHIHQQIRSAWAYSVNSFMWCGNKTFSRTDNL